MWRFFVRYTRRRASQERLRHISAGSEAQIRCEMRMTVNSGPRLSRVELLPEIQLHLFDSSTGLFDPAGGEYRSDRPPPFWAFAWAGGQAVARYVLDHPETVRGRRVLDLACGSGVVAVAAAKAGAAQVRAVDVDPAALSP